MKTVKNVKELIFQEYSVYDVRIGFEYEGMKLYKSKDFSDLKKALKLVNELWDMHKLPIIISGGAGKRNIVNRHLTEEDLKNKMDNKELYNKLLSYPNI